MKKWIILTLCSGVLSNYSTTNHCVENLINKITSGDAIKKAELNCVLHGKLSHYGDKFIASGYSSVDKLFVGILEGTRNDTIFHVLLVFKDNKLVYSREAPNASYYLSKGAMVENFVVGRIFSAYSKRDSTCILAYIESIKPYRVDTLHQKFAFRMGDLLSRDSLEFCSSEGTRIKH